MQIELSDDIIGFESEFKQEIAEEFQGKGLILPPATRVIYI